MKIIEIIAEMAAPQYIHRRRKYYHGTSTESAARGIIEKGIKPQVYTSKRQLTPVSGRAYVTGELGYALMYALGGDFAGHDVSRYLKDSSKDRYGYVFVVKGTELGDIQPDEDSIGEVIAHVLQWNSTPKENRDLKQIGKYWSASDIKLFKNILKDSNAFSQLTQLANYDVTDNQKKKLLDGEYGYYAQVGKKLVKKMSDELKLKLIKFGMHVANEGIMKPSEVWRVDKFRSAELKRDGSNFFDIAERIK